MSEEAAKKRINLTVQSRIDAIQDRYLRTPTANELRAIEELPLRTINNLNDRSETGKRIWRILEKSERTRDVSLLEEAGRLLWEQVTRRPGSYNMTGSSSYPREDSRNRQDLFWDLKSTNVSSHGTTTASRGGRPKDGRSKSDKSHRKSGSGGSPEREGRVVDYNKSVKDRGANEYRDRDGEAFMPLTKRARLTHTQSVPQGIQSQTPYHCQTDLAQGQSVRHDFTSMVSHIPTAHVPTTHVATYHTTQPLLPSHPRTSSTLAVAQNFNSQFSDELSGSSSPPNLQTLSTQPESPLGPGARQYYRQQGNRPRP